MSGHVREFQVSDAFGICSFRAEQASKASGDILV